MTKQLFRFLLKRILHLLNKTGLDPCVLKYSPHLDWIRTVPSPAPLSRGLTGI